MRKFLPSAASPAETEEEEGAKHTERFFKVNKEPVYQEPPVEHWEDLDPQDQEKLEDEATKYDRDKYPPLVAMTQEGRQPAGTTLSLTDQIKMIQGQLIELKVAVDGGNCPRGPQIPFRDQCNPRGKDPPYVNPSAPPPKEPRMWGPPLQPPVWEIPTKQPPPGYVKPGSNSVVRSPLQMACDDAHMQGESMKQFGVYPLFDRLNQAGNRFREWRPFQWKQLKELKEACVQYGPIAPFTMAILDALSGEATPAEDWKHIAHACLSGSDYLLWKSEFYENCKKKANQNALRQIPITFDMLAGEGIYAELRNQMGFAAGAYAQTTAAAKDAWRMLPDTSRKEEHVSQIRQGPDEPFQDFVSRLNTAAGRIFGPSAATQSFIMQLAYENANSACQAAIRPFRKKGTLSDYIRLCSDVGSSFTQGIAIAAAIQGKPMKEVLYQQARLNAGSRSGACFTCGKLGHRAAQCPRKGESENSTASAKKPPDICPKCRRGKHWANECKSKTDKDGKPIQGNWVRGTQEAIDEKLEQKVNALYDTVQYMGDVIQGIVSACIWRVLTSC
nr:PREDICTED: endogenous retrovirus group K member 113 Gag polyprotein-like [Rhinolophus sinicus]